MNNSTVSDSIGDISVGIISGMFLAFEHPEWAQFRYLEMLQTLSPETINMVRKVVGNTVNHHPIEGRYDDPE